MTRKFIKRAIKHRGSLHRFAGKHRAINQNGTINLTKARRAANRLTGGRKTHRIRQINFVRNLRSFHR